MIKKTLRAIAVGVAFLPLLAFAAFNDVSMDGSTILTVASVDLTLTGPTAVLESIEVTSSSFIVAMPANAYLKISSADRRNITTTDRSSVTLKSTCTASVSTYEFESPSTVGGTLTFTVNVGSDTCTTGGSAGGSGSPGGGSGGGGGSSGGSVYSAPAVSTAAVVTTKETVPAVTPKATVTAPAAVSAISVNITRAFAKGATSPQIKTLQQLLNSDPDTRIAATGAGSPGQETTLFGPATLKAIQKFQVKHGIAKPGVEGYGVLGPKTRAKLNELGGKGVVPAAASVKPAASTAQTSAIQKQIDAALAQIKILQEQLKKAK